MSQEPARNDRTNSGSAPDAAVILKPRTLLGFHEALGPAKTIFLVRQHKPEMLTARHSTRDCIPRLALMAASASAAKESSN